MSRRLPPLNALKAFEAAARHESFTRAADELNVTQGAISHQVKALEAALRMKLFVREPQRLILTDAGRDYLVVLRDAFDRIAVGTDRILKRQNASVLTVTTSPNFAAKWLVHRLGRFAERYPDIDLRVSASLQHIDFARDDVDMAIRHGDGSWIGLDKVRLCEEKLFPVCSPRLLTGANALHVPADLANHTLLHLDNRHDWLPDSGLVAQRIGTVHQALFAAPTYLQESGRPAAPDDLKDHRLLAFSLADDVFHWPLSGPDGDTDVPINPKTAVSNSIFLRDLLIAGQGIGALPSFIYEPAVKTGALECVLPEYSLPPRRIYAVIAHRLSADAKTRTFVDFLRHHLSEAGFG